MGWQDDPVVAPAASTPPAAPTAPAGAPSWQSDPIVASANVIGQEGPQPASGLVQSIEAGLQGSALGLAWRGKLPDLIMDPQNSAWWERAAAGIAQVGAELPLMAAGGAAGGLAGGSAGGAAGSVVPGLGTAAGAAAGTLLGSGAGMFAVPAAIRESLIQAYKSGDVMTAADWWNALHDVATTTLKEGAIGAATFGAGSVAARTVGKALVPAIGESIAVPTAIKAINAADTAAQIATMVSMPAALQGRLPDAQEFLDAAIVIGGLKLAAPVAERLANVYRRTGKTPAEQVQDAQQNPEVADELRNGPKPDVEVPPLPGQLSKQEELWSIQDRLMELGKQPGGATPADVSVALSDYADNLQLRGDAKAWAEKLPGMPHGVYEALSNISPADRGAAEEGQLQELRRRVLEAREDPQIAMRAVWGPELADAPPELRRAIERGMAMPEAPPGAAPGVSPSDFPRFSPDQLAEAQNRAKTRLDELSAKATTEALTDAERAERIGLTNSMGNPEALAKRYGMEPAVKPITDADREASAQRVYDDVLRQAREADAARQAAGLTPIGDDHALAIATLVRARLRARAARLGVLPEDLYNERPLQIRDESQAEVEAQQAAIPPEAERFVPPPEVDLFGNPVLPTNAPRVAGEAIPVVPIPLDQLKLSKDVPQFKAGANARGVVQPLQGEVDLRGVAPIAVWERLNGDLEVISGRHRLDLWERKGRPTIDAQIFKESEGFDLLQATMLDAEMNIRDEHGSVSDYANYFKNSGISEAEAKSRGLLGRAKGQAGFRIAQDASPDLLAAHRAGLLSDDAALVISGTAPGSERLQALGMAMVNDGKSTLFASNMMKTIDLMAAERQAAGQQGDIFGFDDSAMRQAAAMAKKASAAQRKISEQISAVQGAARRPEIARKLGVDVQDPEGIQKKIASLKQEQYQWDNWPLYPELVAKLRAADLKQPALLPGETQWYHGAREDLSDLTRGSMLYITDRPEEAGGYAKGGHLGGTGELQPRVYSIAAKEGKTLDINDLIDEEVMNGDGEIERALDAGIAKAKAEGARYVQYNHPTFTGGPEQVVRIALYPAEDLRVTHQPSENRDGVLYQDEFELKPETPAELRARDAEAAAAAKRKLAQEREGTNGIRAVSAAHDYPPAMREKIMAGMPLFQKPGQEREGQHLGSYSIAENLITTFRNANKSTIIHELGHSWLEEMRADAMRPDAPAQIKADWETIRREFAIGENAEISTASHEQFARTAERYLGEGVAPSIGLRGVFERFKAWMLELYSNLQNLGVQINPEVRGVFDRMLATDQEIADAKALNVPVAYVPEARRAEAEKIVPPPEGRKIVPGFEAEQASMVPYADELPPGPGEAPDTSHVNYAYINSPMDVKLAMQRMAEIDQANIQKQRGGTKGVKSWAEANAEQARYVNDILGGTEDTLRLLSPRDPNAPGPDVKLGILKKLAVGAAKDSARLRDIVLEAGHDATIRQQLEYMGSIERARMIQAEFLGERAGVARALNALKDVTEGSGEIGRMLDAIGYGEAAARELYQAARTPAEEQAYLKAQLDEILQRYVGGKKGPDGKPVFVGSVLDIAKLHKEIGTLKGSFRMAKELERATTWEMVVEGWRAGLLSGPVTHTTNMFGTAAFHVMRTPVDALAAIIGMARGASPGMGESDRASMSEAIAGLTSYLTAAKDGLTVGYHTFMADQTTGKTESYREAIPGRAGQIIRIPLRLMGAEDAMVTTMYERKLLTEYAMRQAFDEQLNPATREFASRVDYLKDHPTPEIQAAVDSEATRLTFNAPLGEKGAALQNFVRKWNLQWMIPFIRTPINIAKELLRMSPFAPAVAEWRQAIAKGGIERDKALAEITLGTGITALTMAYAFAGNISGNGSPDPGKNRGKAGVLQPYSILIGDTWYDYSRIQPTGTLMGMAADIAAIWDHMTPEEMDKVPKMLAAAFSQAITNQTFLQGITNVVNAMSDPTRFGPSFLQQFAGSMVPNVIGQPTAMADPIAREINGMIEEIQARIPGFRQQLAPKLDWLGQPVPGTERLGVIMPVRELHVSDDKVRQEAARLDISLAGPPKKTHIGKVTGKLGDVPLTPEEQHTFAEVGGKMAHEILTNIVNQPDYDAIPDLVKRKIFAKVLVQAHQVAAVAALPPEKRVEYLTSISEKMATALEPETE